MADGNLGKRDQIAVNISWPYIPKQSPVDRDDQLLVTLLDGRLLAVDSSTGQVNWSLDLGRPLVSGSGAWHEELAGAKDALSRTILPGADGSLYIVTDIAGSPQEFEVPCKQAKICLHRESSVTKIHFLLQRLPTSVPKLVSASPSSTADGTIMLGSHHSSIYVVDSQDGALLSILPTGQHDAENEAGNSPAYRVA